MNDDKESLDNNIQFEGFQKEVHNIESVYETELKKVQEETENLEENYTQEQKAKQFGHLTREEWIAQGKDPNKWKSPEEFNKYGEEYKEVREVVKSLKEQNSELTKEIKTLVNAQKQSALQAVQQAKLELERQLGLARDRGDVDAIQNITKQQVQLDFRQEQEKIAFQNQEMANVDRIFIERNKHWFNDSRPDLKQRVSEISAQLDQFFPGITYAEKAHRIEERMKFEHPEFNVTSSVQVPISMSNSNVNKQVASVSSNEEDRLYRNLSTEEKAEFNAVNKLLSGNSKNLKTPLKYTVKEFIESIKRG